MLAWCVHLQSAEPLSHLYNYTITADCTRQTHLPITALSNQGALDFAKGYATQHASDTNAADSSSTPYKNEHTSSLNFESHTNTMHISGSTDPLSIIYLVRDSPEILAGLFDGAIKGIHYIFDTTGKHKRRKDAQAIEEYLYKVDQDRAFIYLEHSFQEAIAQDLTYLEERIQELSIATYTMTAPPGCYTIYCHLEERLRNAYKALLQQHPRSYRAQLEAEQHSAQYALRYVKKTKFKDKKFKKETITQCTDRVDRAEKNLRQLHEEQTQKYVAGQRIRDAQITFNKEQYDLFVYCIEQQETIQDWYDENPAWHERLAARQEAFDTTKPFQTIEASYTLSEKALADLNLYDLDTAYIQNLTGNHYQHQLQRELADIIEAATETCFMRASYQEILLTCSVSACAYNQIGESLNATRIADFCWAFLDYGTAAIEGVGIGLSSALLHVITHPVETTLYAAARPYMMAYQLTTVLYSVVDIGITHTYDPELAHQKWNEFVQPVTDIYAALTDKEHTTRDTIKTGMALATSFYAQMKLIGGLQKLCNGVLQEITTWAKARMYKTPQDLLASSEGPVFQQLSNETAFENIKNSSTPKSHLSNAGSLNIDIANNAECIATAINDIIPNKIHHILTPKTGKHAWNRVCKNALDWNEVKEVIRKVMSEGIIEPRKIGFQKTLTMGVDDVVVTFIHKSDGTLVISDAWVKTI